MTLHIIILAAGQGKRMHSSKAKVLHEIAAKPMLRHVIEVAQQLQPEKIHVVIGHAAQQIKNAFSDTPVNWVTQEQQLGTGHAVMQALPFIPSTANILILSGDVPLIQKETLIKLLDIAKKSTCLALLTALLENPAGLGRILRDGNKKIYAIVEEKDATETQRQVKEIYTGICCVPASMLNEWLPMLNCQNAQGEYYLTEIIALANNQNFPLDSFTVQDPIEVQGVNDRLQLQQLERAWQLKYAEKLMREGVTLADATRIDVRGEISAERDTFIDVNTVFEGNVRIGEGSKIGPNCVLKNVVLGKNCEVYANSVLEGCEIAENCQIGPFARLRPGTKLAKHCKIGNFVETKNAVFDESSKANHLTYLGDVTLGKNVNVGAGTITCNYDGAYKHQTVIEDGVFIGSDTQLVAPVTVGENATIGAGSTIRKNVPAGELTLTVSTQKTVNGWKRPKKYKEEG
ncbi:bifunctional N-acetylglucosamine-1-phosphate uridyltransferase / glucosamine-1-phosphate N-acetyltransferase [Legionella adelaidensis]|uniref:Bifunctional protein GlmU n=1 Tax=Legionella adelaidensis TaxID=45056 RepID=A0A0W0R1C1_9GAMM|nr:bifunctional UDP-N-acetylglucosamine diphosphorylase/glucosamine-1-phosphate N-acetyltransferase GlmU [Legionella adelaidensis]KTC64829.1 bifunctional N-acetylglucosamine-1-phosphate uridyltransferase / glucosamine-1-phosphate N-acetyltransferase [Legionella adelaidensis]